MKRNKLIKSREYWITKIQIQVFEMLENYRQKKHINKTELAKELKVSKGYISQILNGEFNYKISTLVDLSLTLGKVPILKFEDLDKYIERDGLGIYKLPEHEQNVNLTITYDVVKSKTKAPMLST